MFCLGAGHEDQGEGDAEEDEEEDGEAKPLKRDLTDKDIENKVTAVNRQVRWKLASTIQTAGHKVKMEWTKDKMVEYIGTAFDNAF